MIALISLEEYWRAEERSSAIIAYVKIEEEIISPTVAQGLASIRVCQMLSSYYREIQLFRFSDRTGEIYLFVSDEIQIVILRNGTWRFV